jgi:hypothetical protein
MAYVIIAVVSFLAGVVATLAFRIPVEKKLAAERDALKNSATSAIGKL